jgi:hypothetical protein
MKSLTKGYTCLTFTLAAIGANAQVSTLINFPTADCLGHREFQLNQNFSSATPKLNTSYIQSTNYLVGLFDRVELAGIHDWQGNHAFGVKLTPYRSKDEKLAVGVGLQNMRGLRGDPFVNTRYSLGNWNLHAGWLNTTESQATLGVDTMITSKLGGSLEYGSAPSGSAAAILYYSLTEGLLLQAMFTKPNDPTADVNHTVTLTYTFRF